MHIAKHSLWCLLCAGVALLFGCVGDRGYNDLGGGYGQDYSTGFWPDSAGHSAIVYSPGTCRRVHVWPTLMNGYYGSALVHGNLILFQAARPSILHPASELGVFAAKSGAPAVEITQAVRAKAAAVATSAPRPDLSDAMQSALFQRNESGVRTTFPRRDPQGHSEWQEVDITWPQIESLVDRIRATGKSHHFKSVKYYTQD